MTAYNLFDIIRAECSMNYTFEQPFRKLKNLLLLKFVFKILKNLRGFWFVIFVITLH